MSSILKLSAFLVDFCEIKIVFTAINTSAAAEVITQYLIIGPLRKDIKRGLNFSNLDQLSTRITYIGEDHKLFFLINLLIEYLFAIKKPACIPTS